MWLVSLPVGWSVDRSVGRLIGRVEEVVHVEVALEVQITLTERTLTGNTPIADQTKKSTKSTKSTNVLMCVRPSCCDVVM